MVSCSDNGLFAFKETLRTPLAKTTEEHTVSIRTIKTTAYFLFFITISFTTDKCLKANKRIIHEESDRIQRKCPEMK